MTRRIHAVVPLALAVVVAVAGVPASAAIFSDIQGDPNQRAIEKLAVTGLVAGFPDGTFKPNQPITRLEAVTALARGLDIKGTGTIPDYKDLNQIPDSVRPAIAALLNTGAVSQQKSEVKNGDLVFTLATDKAVYGTDDPVDLTLTITNTGKEDAKFTFGNMQEYDFIVMQGTVMLARWGLGQTFIQAPHDLLLAPTKSLTYNTRWLQKDQDSQVVPAGAYEIQAIWMAKDNVVKVSLQFQKGLLTTYPDNTFRPNAQVSRAEFAALIVRALGKQGEATQKASEQLTIKDAADVPPTLHGYVAVAIDDKLMPPFPDGTFRPSAPTTRSDAAGALAGVLTTLKKFTYVSGTFVSITQDEITVSIEAQVTQSYALTPNVAIYRNDQAAAAGDLKPNDKVLMLLTGPKGRAGYIEATGQ